jgi:hypothetical protein
MVEEELKGAERSHDCAELSAIEIGMKPQKNSGRDSIGR